MASTTWVCRIGVGCGDTNLITLEAVSHMARADAFICSPHIKKRFGKYMGDKSVLLNIFDFAPPVLRKNNPELTEEEELRQLMEKMRENAAAIIKKHLDKNKTFAILYYDAPPSWDGWSCARNYFAEKKVEIIPGLNFFNVFPSINGPFPQSRRQTAGLVVRSTKVHLHPTPCFP